MNGLYAIDNGWTGQGVTVGVMDDGANVALSEFAGAIDAANSKDFGYVISGGVRTKRDSLGDVTSTHGTSVAAIIGARKDGTGTMGYAPNVKLAILRISDADKDAGDNPLIHGTEALAWAGDRGIKVVNSSLSSGGSIFFGNALTAYGNKTKGLVVNSAGNLRGDEPEDAAAITDANRSAIIFVVATNGALLTSQFGLATYSNKAGSMMDRTVAAPGTNVTVRADGSIATFSGTSSAAPVVTGLAATILSKWPQLTGQQAGDIILNTARDIGDPGTDKVFGRGLVDFKAALSPVNPTLSNSVAAKASSVDASVMGVSPVMGTRSIRDALSDVTMLDEYGRDFAGSLSGLVLQPEAKGGHWLRRRVAGMNGGSEIQAGGVSARMGFVRTEIAPGIVRSEMTAGEMSVVTDGYGFRAAWNAAESLQNDLMGMAPFADGILAYVPQASNSFGVDRYVGGGKLSMTMAVGRDRGNTTNAVTLGWSKNDTDLRMSMIDETGTVMGMPVGASALALGRGASTFMVEAHRRVGSAFGWSVEGYGSVGYTRLKIDSASLVTGASPIIGTRLGVQATGSVLSGLLSFGVAQPLVVETGSARLTYGSGYDFQSQSLSYATADADLAGRRQVQLTAGFAKGGPRSSFRIGVTRNLQDGTVRTLGAWTSRF